MTQQLWTVYTICNFSEPDDGLRAWGLDTTAEKMDQPYG